MPENPHCVYFHPILVEKVVFSSTDLNVEDCISCHLYEQTLSYNNKLNTITSNDNQIIFLTQQAQTLAPYSFLLSNILSLSENDQNTQTEYYLLNINNPIAQSFLHLQQHQNSLQLIYLIKKINCLKKVNTLLKQKALHIKEQITLPQLLRNRNLLSISCQHRRNIEYQMSCLQTQFEFIPCIQCHVDQYQIWHIKNLKMYLEYLKKKRQQVYQNIKLEHSQIANLNFLLSTIKNTDNSPEGILEILYKPQNIFSELMKHCSDKVIHLLHLKKLFLIVERKIQSLQ
ncbi:hypothetical protein AB837_00548 [bacterium AB1]|nr:hypothetical protein AB837_00548 [bacterium AB1]